MDFNIALGIAGWAVLIVAALAVGIVVELLGEVQFGYEWILTGVAGVLGGLIASEFVIGWRTFEPVWDGLALVPAALGGLVAALVVAAVTRLATGGHFLRPVEA